MGLIKNVHCNNCGKHWRRFEGSGFSCEIYFCNKCGEKNVSQIFESCPDLWEQYSIVYGKWQSEKVTEEKLFFKKQLTSIGKQIKKHKCQTIGICDCSGKYELNGNIIICPDCHSQDVSDDGILGNWD